MLQPKKTKYRLHQKGRIHGIETRAVALAFGQFGLKTFEAGRITSAQIEAARRAITHYLKKEGKLWIRIFPDHAITSKGVEVAMGAGKGDVVGYAAPIKPGRIIFELDGVSQDTAREALRRAGHKLPVKTLFVASA